MNDKKILRGSMFGYKKDDCLNYIKDLDDSLKEKENEKTALLKKETEYLSEIDDLSAKNISLEKTISDNNKEISNLQNRISQNEAEISALKEKINSITELYEKKTDELANLAKDNDELKEKIISLISDKDNISIKYNKLYTYYEKNKNEISEAILLSKQQGEEIIRNAKSESEKTIRNAKFESEKIIKNAISEKERIYRENDEKLTRRIFELDKVISEKSLKKKQLDEEIKRLVCSVRSNFENTEYAVSQFKNAFSEEIDKILSKFSGLGNYIDNDEN